MMLSPENLQAIWLTLRLATTATLLLLLIGTPLAWWLARTHSWLRGPVAAIVALPLVLPPTVLGFYLLLAFAPAGPIGQLTGALGLGSLAFTFEGLVIGSILFSLPFVVQPIQNSFHAMGDGPLEVAATFGASPWRRFFTVAIPLARPGIISGSILGFAHTVGEFGRRADDSAEIFPAKQVVSAIYEQVRSAAIRPGALAGGNHGGLSPSSCCWWCTARIGRRAIHRHENTEAKACETRFLT